MKHSTHPDYSYNYYLIEDLKLGEDFVQVDLDLEFYPVESDEGPSYLTINDYTLKSVRDDDGNPYPLKGDEQINELYKAINKHIDENYFDIIDKQYERLEAFGPDPDIEKD